jgi:hypothetical protein
MVRAILAGTKTQTRRVVKRNPPFVQGDALRWFPGGEKEGFEYLGHATTTLIEVCGGWASSWCPYGAPGDRLWVRESCRYEDTFYKGPGVPPEHFRAQIEYRDGVIVRKDVDMEHWTCACESNTDRWRSPLYMPRWASRITLEVTAVRVERLCDISEADAFAEGVESRFCARCDESGVEDGGPCPDCAGEGRFLCYSVFRELWESINGKGSWAANPWVWVVQFKWLHGSELSAALGDEGVGK